jgi:Predicted membrane protein
MDAIIATVQQFLIDMGYPGLFVSAMLAGSIVPFSSEVVLVVLIKLGFDPLYSVVWASLGNTAGGMSCYYIGYLGKIEWAEKYFKVKHEKILKMQKFLQGKGAMMAFFAFLPTIGEVISMALGFMRSNILLTTTSMFVGKLVRYIFVVYCMLYAVDGFLSMIHNL